MNAQQRYAIEHPCRFGWECANPRFGYWDPPVSVVLTVNTGYE